MSLICWRLSHWEADEDVCVKLWVFGFSAPGWNLYNRNPVNSCRGEENIRFLLPGVATRSRVTGNPSSPEACWLGFCRWASKWLEANVRPGNGVSIIINFWTGSLLQSGSRMVPPSASKASQHKSWLIHGFTEFRPSWHGQVQVKSCNNGAEADEVEVVNPEW